MNHTRYDVVCDLLISIESCKVGTYGQSLIFFLPSAVLPDSVQPSLPVINKLESVWLVPSLLFFSCIFPLDVFDSEFILEP